MNEAKKNEMMDKAIDIIQTNTVARIMAGLKIQSEIIACSFAAKNTNAITCNEGTKISFTKISYENLAEQNADCIVAIWQKENGVPCLIVHENDAATIFELSRIELDGDQHQSYWHKEQTDIGQTLIELMFA